MPLKLIPSKNGNPMMVHEGYIYSYKNDNICGTVTWRCKQYSKYSCRVIIHTSSTKKTGKLVVMIILMN